MHKNFLSGTMSSCGNAPKGRVCFFQHARPFLLVCFSEMTPPGLLGREKKLSLPASGEAGRDEQLYDCQKNNLGQMAPVYGPQGK